MIKPQTKQEESVMIQKATEAFLQTGGKIERLYPIRAYGYFNMDIWKERIEPDLCLHEVETTVQAKHKKVEQKTEPTIITKERIHPWRHFNV